MLSLPNLLTLLDSMAAQVAAFEDGVGVVGNEAGTVALGASSNLALALALADTDVDIATGLIGALSNRLTRVKAPSLYHTISGRELYRALESHYASVGGLNTFLRTGSATVHPDVAKLGMMIDTDLRFPPAEVLLGTMVMTGSGAGDWTPGGEVDPSLYGDARLALVVGNPGPIGGSQLNVTIITSNRAEAQTSEQAIIPVGSAAGTRVTLATRGQQVVDIDVVGGTASDHFTVVAEVERVVAL